MSENHGGTPRRDARPARPGRAGQLWLIPILTFGSALTLKVVGLANAVGSMFSGTTGPIVGACLGAFGLAVILPPSGMLATFVLDPTSSRSKRSAIAVGGLVVLDAFLIRGLSAVLPFRFGLLSCLYYFLPAVLLTLMVPPRSKRRMLTFGLVLVVGASLVLPVRAVQAGVAAQQWLDRSGVSGRAQAQIVVLPEWGYDSYELYQGTLIADFIGTDHVSDYWAAVETVTPGKVNPCGKVTSADGDGDDDESLPCRQVASDLWLRGGQADQDIGYVLQRDGMTITVIAPAETEPDALRQAILAAHPASNEELWSREGDTGTSLFGFLLL